MKRSVFVLGFLAMCAGQIEKANADVLDCTKAGDTASYVHIQENVPTKGQAVLKFANGMIQLTQFTEKTSSPPSRVPIVQIQKTYVNAVVKMGLFAQKTYWNDNQNETNPTSYDGSVDTANLVIPVKCVVAGAINYPVNPAPYDPDNIKNYPHR
jgi:hypothetical protein